MPPQESFLSPVGAVHGGWCTDGAIGSPIVLEFGPRFMVEKEENDDVPDYRDPGDIPESELRIALCGLNLLGDDLYLRMQTLNLSIVDQFLMGLEYDTLQKLNDQESTPTEATFLSAMSQMWIFAAYELLRTWRQRAKEVLKLVQSGGLAQKVEALERSAGKFHVADPHTDESARTSSHRPRETRSSRPEELHRLPPWVWAHQHVVRITRLRDCFRQCGTRRCEPPRRC